MKIQLRLPVLVAIALCAPCTAFAGTVDGVVENGTTNRVVPGADVILIQLQGGMQPIATTKTDSQGRYHFDRPEIGAAPMLIRVSYRGVLYHEPLPPGKAAANVQVFDPTANADSVEVTTQAIIIQPQNGQLTIGEEYTIQNRTKPPVSYYDSKGTFNFEIPQGGQLGQVSAWSSAGMPVIQDTIGKGKNRSAIAFAFKPGENGVRFSYQIPYPGNKATINAVSLYPVGHVIIAAQPGVQVSGQGLLRGGTEQGFELYGKESVGADSPIELAISGMPTGGAGDSSVTSAADATQDPSVNSRVGDSSAPSAAILPARLDSLKWILVAGFGGLFALGALFLMRRPQAIPGNAGVQAPQTAQQNTRSRAQTKDRDAAAGPDALERGAFHKLDAQAQGSLDELKDQLFRLELRRQAGTVSDEEYASQRERVEKTLRELVRG
jgi:hypothetical protein